MLRSEKIHYFRVKIITAYSLSYWIHCNRGVKEILKSSANVIGFSMIFGWLCVRTRARSGSYREVSQ